MSYIVFARKWRPQQFSDLVGQEAICRTLQNSIKLQRLPHAILLTGMRGIGKTSTARILAKALNCEKGPSPTPCDSCSNCTEITAGSNMDVREIDGASATSVDDIRDLRENIRYSPSKSKHKIYIIDEVHMLSTSAFNALLKTLEEPPKGVYFIFATTEPHKIPDTIISRCQRFDFKQVSEEQIAKHLQTIVEKEEIQISKQSLYLLSRQAEGSLRDALSLLDQVLAFSGSFTSKEVSEEEVISVLGFTDRNMIYQTLEAFAEHDGKKALQVLSEVLEKGFDPHNYLLEIWERIRDLLLMKFDGNEKLVRLSKDEIERFRDWNKNIHENELERWFGVIQQTMMDIRRSEFPRYIMEMAFFKITRKEIRLPLSQLVERLENLEQRLYSTVTNSKGTCFTSNEKTTLPCVSSEPEKQYLGQLEKKNETFEQQWKLVIDQTKRQKPSFAAILLQTLKTEIQDSNIALWFEEESFYISRAQDNDFRTYIEQIASEVMGYKCTLIIKMQPKSQEKEASQHQINRALEKETLENSTITKAISMFQAKIEEIKPVK